MEPDSPPDSPVRPRGANSHEYSDTRTHQSAESRDLPNEETNIEGAHEDREQNEIESNNDEIMDDIERSENDEKIEDTKETTKETIEDTENTTKVAEKATGDAEQESESSGQENEDAEQETNDVEVDDSGAEAGDEPDYENDQTTDDIESDDNATNNDNDRRPVHDRVTSPIDEEVEELSDSDIYRAGDDDEDLEVQATNRMQTLDDIPLAIRRGLCEPRPRPQSWAQEFATPGSSHRNSLQLVGQDAGESGQRRPTSSGHRFMSSISSLNLLQLSNRDAGSRPMSQEFMSPSPSPSKAIHIAPDWETDNQDSIAENDFQHMREQLTGLLSDATALASQVKKSPPAGKSREELLAENAALRERLGGLAKEPSREDLWAHIAALEEDAHGRPGEPSRDELLAHIATLEERIDGPAGEPSREELVAEIVALKQSRDGPRAGSSREELLMEIASLAQQNAELKREIQSVCNERDLVTAEFNAMKDSQEQVDNDSQVDIATSSAALKNTLRQNAWAIYGEETPLPNTQAPAEKLEEKLKGVEVPEKATAKQLPRLDVGESSSQGAKSEWARDNVWEQQRGTADNDEPDTPHPDSIEASPKKIRSRSGSGYSKPLGSIDEYVEMKDKGKLSSFPYVTSASLFSSGGGVRESLGGFAALDSGTMNSANRSPDGIRSTSSLGSGLSPSYGWREPRQPSRYGDSSTSLGDGVRNTLDEEMNMGMSPPFSGGMGTLESLPDSSGNRHPQSSDLFGTQSSGSQHPKGQMTVPAISTPTEQRPKGPQHGREGGIYPIEEGESPVTGVRPKSKLSKLETAKSWHLWVVLTYCVLFFFTVQVLISCRRQKHIWFAANGLTRNYMLDAYRFDRTWLGGVGIDTALFSNWSEAQEWLVNLWPFGEGAKAFRW